MTIEQVLRLRDAARAAKEFYEVELSKAECYGQRIRNGNPPPDEALERSMSLLQQRHEVLKQTLTNYEDAIEKLTPEQKRLIIDQESENLYVDSQKGRRP